MVCVYVLEERQGDSEKRKGPKRDIEEEINREKKRQRRAEQRESCKGRERKEIIKRRGKRKEIIKRKETDLTVKSK